MVLYSLNIINKDGGLVYHKQYVKTQNIDLRLVSSFHILHAMACQVNKLIDITVLFLF